MSIYLKLLTIQNKLKVPKNQENTFGRYKYRNCEDILESVKPLLKTENAVLTLSDELCMMGTRFYIKVTALLTDAESGESICTTAYAREEETKKGMDGSQITGASSSYARKYALNGLFGIDDTKDSDMTNANQKINPAAPEKLQKCICSNCGKEVKNKKKADGEIVPAQVVYESCGQLCTKCYHEKMLNQKISLLDKE